jgi:hypothetical protein
MRRAHRWLALAGAASLACGTDFTPRSVLADLRVLAVVPTPLEVGPGEAVSATARTLPPPGATITGERWSFCPFTLGGTAAYACAAPACEVPLQPGPDGAVAFDPAALARQCLTTLAAGGGVPAGIPAELPATLPTQLRYVVTSSDGQEREAVQQVPLWTAGAPADRNVPPVVVSTSIGGQVLQAGATAPPLAPGGQLEVRVLLDPAGAQRYTGGAGEPLTESLLVSYYTTAGRYDYDWVNGPDAVAHLKYEQIDASVTQAQVWVVARDLRGGEVVVGPFLVPVLH